MEPGYTQLRQEGPTPDMADLLQRVEALEEAQGDGEPQPLEAYSDANKCTKFVIDQVNPKFQQYDKPLLLALLVGATTLFLAANVFVALYYLGHTKVSHTFIRDKDMKAELSKTSVACVANTAEMVIDTGSKAIGATTLHYPLSGGAHGFAFVRAQSCTVPYGAVRCDGFKNDVAGDSYARFPVCGSSSPFPMYDQASGGTGSSCSPSSCGPRAAPGVGDGNGAFGRVGIFVVELEMNPDLGTTLGAALGYTAFFELVVTIIYTLVLTKFGCLSGGDASYMSGWIKDLISQKHSVTANKLAGQSVVLGA